jgi:hypothetical protein
MSAVRVILITVAGPSGHVDVGVRSDATPADLAEALGGVIGVSRATAVIEHRAPPRPGVPEGGRVLVRPGTALADAGVADGDLVLFRSGQGGGGISWPEVQARPTEFGPASPPMDAPAELSPAIDAPAREMVTASAPTGPAAPAEPDPADPWPPAEPAEPSESSAPAEPAEPSAPDAWATAGRHARSRTTADESTQSWGPDSLEVNADDWRG